MTKYGMSGESLQHSTAEHAVCIIVVLRIKVTELVDTAFGYSLTYLQHVQALEAVVRKIERWARVKEVSHIIKSDVKGLIGCKTNEPPWQASRGHTQSEVFKKSDEDASAWRNVAERAMGCS